MAPGARDAAAPSDRTGPLLSSAYWLAARCRHSVVYAMNEEQVAHLESFIAAGLRERNRGAHGWANSSYISRLPGWMKAPKNRAELLACLGRLKAKLPGRGGARPSRPAAGRSSSIS